LRGMLDTAKQHGAYDRYGGDWDEAGVFIDFFARECGISLEVE